jgi:hypothetical protein
MQEARPAGEEALNLNDSGGPAPLCKGPEFPFGISLLLAFCSPQSRHIPHLLLNDLPVTRLLTCSRIEAKSLVCTP